MIANLYVVGNLDLVIELHAVTDHGIGQGPAINSGVHTDFHVVTDQYAADLGNLVPDTLGVGKAKAFAADHSTRLNDHTLTNTHIVVERHTRGQPAIGSDFATRADKAVGTHRDTSANTRTTLDHGERTNTGRRVNLGIIGDHGRRMNTAGRFRLGIEQV